MSDFSAVEVSAARSVSALQGPTTNSLVHNPFAFDEVEGTESQSAPQSPTTNSLVHNPFAFSD